MTDPTEHPTERPAGDDARLGSISTRAAAYAARRSVNCPVCGQWKRAGAMLCHECTKGMTQADRNVIANDIDAYRNVVRDLRAMRQARTMGMRLLADGNEQQGDSL